MILIEMLAVYVDGNIRSVKYLLLFGLVAYLQADLFTRLAAY